MRRNLSPLPGMSTLLLLVAMLSCHPARNGSEVGQHWLAALNAHDAGHVMAMLDPKAQFTDPVVPHPFENVEFRARLERDWASWKDRRYVSRSIETIGESVVIEWHIDQTHSNGQPVPLDGLTILQMTDGKIYRIREYYDASVYLPFLRPR